MTTKISGAGTLSAGEYDEIKLSGAMKLLGEIKCASLSASGAVNGESIECSGEINVSGAAKFSGSVTAKNVRISGAFKASSVNNCDEFSASGAIKLEGELSANEKAEITGAVKAGAVKAKSVTIKFDASSEAESVKGESINLAPRKYKIFKRRFISSSIEGDEITLEYVSCPRVFGKRVTIGKGCRIGLLEYSESVQISPKAKVEKTEQIF